MMFSKSFLLGCAVSLLAPSVSGLALPTPDQLEARDLEGRSFANGLALRIMPLGASITHGVASSTGDGYRLDLRKALVANGNEVNMVGNNPNGTMHDNQNEGWPGYVITQIHTKANASLPRWKPNLVLINAGTNDCVQNVDIPNAGKRMRSMIHDVYTKSPDSTVVLSSLVVNANKDTQARAVTVNAEYQKLAASMQKAGKRIVYVDMQGPDGPTTADLSSDGTHPKDGGYQKMANIWYKGIQDANSRGFLKAAAKNDVPADGGA